MLLYWDFTVLQYDYNYTSWFMVISNQVKQKLVINSDSYDKKILILGS
jgi:hypothetical protein